MQKELYPGRNAHIHRVFLEGDSDLIPSWERETLSEQQYEQHIKLICTLTSPTSIVDLTRIANAPD